jgi:hypothetical protein
MEAADRIARLKGVDSTAQSNALGIAGATARALKGRQTPGVESRFRRADAPFPLTPALSLRERAGVRGKRIAD